MSLDVTIIGGGLVGGSLACALRGLGLRVAVIEAMAPDAASHPSYDERVIALSLGSQRIFTGMGLWDAMRDQAEPIRRVHVSDRGRFGFARLSAEDEGVEALGYVTSARGMGQAIEAVLQAAVTDLATDSLTDAEKTRVDCRPPGSLELIRPARLIGLRATSDHWQLEVSLADGGSRVLQTRLLVAADGGDSEVRRRLKLAVRERDYAHDAIITTIKPERPHQGVAYERFTDSGPLAMLPMTEGRCSVVWTARREDSAKVTGLGDEDFVAALQSRFGRRLGRLSRPGRRVAYPLRLALARELTRPRFLLIGNAAHTLHPVAGQGFNLGLRDVAELADLLADAVREGRDPGDESVVRGYRCRRAPDQGSTALLTDALARLFVNPWSPVRFGRDLGLTGLNLVGPARHLLARRFMGLVGRQPRLARGIPLMQQQDLRRGNEGP